MKKKNPLRIDQMDIFFYWIVEKRRETIEQFYIRSNENFLERELQTERLPDKVVFRVRTADDTLFRSFDFAWSHSDTIHEYFFMLRQNWQIIWEWFYQKHLYDETPFQVYPFLNFEEDRHNTEKVMRHEGLYYEEVLNTWVDLAYSLPAIGRAIRKSHIDKVTR